MFPLNAFAENGSYRENMFRTSQMMTQLNNDGNEHGNGCANNQMDICDNDVRRAKADLSNLKVTVGIDEDLQMILEMDPSIVDLVRNYCAFLFRIS